jgi:hypothetical protein
MNEFDYYVLPNNFGRTKSDSEHVRTQGASILVTNVCNLACGGCTVLCGTLKKESLYFISPEQFRIEVPIAGKQFPLVALYGGEPTTHPKFNELMDICENEFPHFHFCVYTNGFKPFDGRTNVSVRLDYKDKDFNQDFVSTLVAPIDTVGIKSKDFYWELARNRCCIFNDCAVQLCNGKAYICQVAASLERLHGTDKGWKVEEGQDPFVRTDEEIREQGRAFCHKCTYCQPGEFPPRQQSKEPSVVTITNIGVIAPKHKPTLKENPRAKVAPEVRKEATRFLMMA